MRSGRGWEAVWIHTDGADADEWDAHGDIPAAVGAACRQGAVIAALAGYFRRNWRHGGDDGPAPPPDGPEALARRTVERLLSEESFMVADVAGMRFHLTYGTPLYPAETVIHVNVWDEDDEVWRLVGQVAVPPGASA